MPARAAAAALDARPHDLTGESPLSPGLDRVEADRAKAIWPKIAAQCDKAGPPPASSPRSLLITANQPFGESGRVFPDQAMTLAAIDRLVHHATILEMNVESFRRKAALDRKRGPGRKPVHATPRELENAADWRARRSSLSLRVI